MSNAIAIGGLEDALEPLGYKAEAPILERTDFEHLNAQLHDRVDLHALVAAASQHPRKGDPSQGYTRSANAFRRRSMLIKDAAAPRARRGSEALALFVHADLHHRLPG